MNSEIVAYRVKTLYGDRTSKLAHDLSDVTWVREHTIITENDKTCILMEYPGAEFKALVEHFYLKKVIAEGTKKVVLSSMSKYMMILIKHIYGNDDEMVRSLCCSNIDHTIKPGVAVARSLCCNSDNTRSKAIDHCYKVMAFFYVVAFLPIFPDPACMFAIIGYATEKVLVLAITSDSRTINSSTSVDHWCKVMTLFYVVACLAICPGPAFIFAIIGYAMQKVLVLTIASDSCFIKSFTSIDHCYKVMAFIYVVAYLAIFPDPACIFVIMGYTMKTVLMLAIASDSLAIISSISVDHWWKVMAFIYVAACLSIAGGMTFELEKHFHPSIFLYYKDTLG